MIEYQFNYDKENEEYRIVPKEEFGIEKKCPSNLSQNQFKVSSLEVEDCPKNRSCIRINGEISVICKYFGGVPDFAWILEPDKSHAYVDCNYNGGKKG